MAGLRYLLPGLLLLAVACGTDVKPTVQPAATATVEPTVRIPPTPTALPLSARSAQEWAIRGLTAVRAFPPELEAESKPLRADDVEALWTEFLAGSRVVDNETVQEVWDLCSDHTGANLEYFDGTELEGESFKWSVRKDPGGRWNAIRIERVTDDPSLRPPEGPLSTTLEREGGVLTFPEGGIKEGVAIFFESPDCD